MELTCVVMLVATFELCLLRVHADDDVWIDCTEDGQNQCTDQNAFCHTKGITAICRCRDGYLEDRRNLTQRKCVKANGRWLNCDRNSEDRACSDPNADCPYAGKVGVDCKCKGGFLLDKRLFNDWRCVEISDDMTPFECSISPAPCEHKNFGYVGTQCYCLPDALW